MQPSDWISLGNLVLTGILIYFTVREARINSEYRNKEKIFDGKLERLARIRELTWANATLVVSVPERLGFDGKLTREGEPIVLLYTKQFAEADTLINTFSDYEFLKLWNTFALETNHLLRALEIADADMVKLTSAIWESAGAVVSHTYKIV